MRFNAVIGLAYVAAACSATTVGNDPPEDGPVGGNGNLPPGSIFPADNAWNTDISGAEIDPKSERYLASIGLTTGLHADFGAEFGIPYVVIPAGTTPVPVVFEAYADESEPGPYPLPLQAPIEAGDGHVIGVDLTNGFLYELFKARIVGTTWHAANGAKWNLRSNASRPRRWTSADAAGLPIFPGLVRYDEAVEQKRIAHALRFTVKATQKGFVSPANHASGSCAFDSDCPPMGLRVRLKASFDISSFPPTVQVILQALKQYGMMVADNGSNWYVSGAPDPRWNNAELSTLSRVKGSDFEVVRTSPIQAW